MGHHSQEAFILPESGKCMGEDTYVIKGQYVVYNRTIDVVQPLVMEGDRRLTAPMDAAKGSLLMGTQNR